MILWVPLHLGPARRGSAVSLIKGEPTSSAPNPRLAMPLWPTRRWRKWWCAWFEPRPPEAVLTSTTLLTPYECTWAGLRDDDT